jgi:hypothetical protein
MAAEEAWSVQRTGALLLSLESLARSAGVTHFDDIRFMILDDTSIFNCNVHATYLNINLLSRIDINSLHRYLTEAERPGKDYCLVPGL